MLSTYAEFLASGGVRPGAAAQVGYDPDVEAQKLAFEKQKWEAQLRKEEAKLRREEAEQRRWEADRVERQRKELVEDERRQTEMQQQAELFAPRQRELDRQMARDRAEEARRDSAVLKGKLFGDAMRASAIRMGWTLLRPFHFSEMLSNFLTYMTYQQSCDLFWSGHFLTIKLRLSLGNWVLKFWEIMSV